MPKMKYENIYKDLKEKIETGVYPGQTFIPSENQLVNVYGCSRNTVRRAIRELSAEGYLQSQKGRGVFVIYQPISRANYLIGGIETFKDSAKRNHLEAKTTVIVFEEIKADENISRQSGFPVGSDLYLITKIRYLDGKPLILDINMFLKDVVKGLTKEIVEDSTYSYLEEQLGVSIMTSKRTMSVERRTEVDERYLELNDYNCMAVITGQVYTKDGTLFEFTQSRHRPDYFCFEDIATRK
jgi:GntR family trehalose operon transcriptional repressor